MRLFTAIDVPAEIKKHLAKIASELPMEGISLAKEDSYHITLHFFGDVNESRLDEIKASIDSVSMVPFNATILGIGYFTPQRIRVIFARISDGSESMKSIYDQISESLRQKNVAFDDEKEHEPHITLARVKNARQEPLLSYIEKYSGYNFGSFLVDSILLKKSTPTPSGHVHETLYKVEL